MDQSLSEPIVGHIAFGPFSVFPRERRLTRDGVDVDIGGRALDLLIALLESPGQVLLKKDLLKRVWPDLTVEDGSLRFHMTNLRRLLGDGQDGARYIATQVGVGYAFVAPFERRTTSPSPTVVAPSGAAGRSAPRLPGSGHLPARLALVGRDPDAARIVDHLAEAKLLTIVGTGGIGKTSLAIEIGHRLSGAAGCVARFIDLAQVEDETLVPSAVMSALGLQVQAEDPMVVLLAHLRVHTCLLIVDNCEHVIEAVCRLVERIRSEAPATTILATSREPLRARDEHVHWLEPLGYPLDPEAIPADALLAFPAVALFVRRARAGNTSLDFSDEDVRLVADICRRLEGLALSIELTAIRAATHGLQATHALLGEQLSLGWSGRRTALPRQQTLLATFDWSYNLLTAMERLTFERLSVFVGPFSMQAAVEVAGDADLGSLGVVQGLDGLAAKGLVALDANDGPGAYRLLEMTRAYAKDRLAARAIKAPGALAHRHAAYYAGLLGRLGDTPQQVFEAAVRLSDQLGNIRAALEWSFGPDGDTATGIALAAAAAPVFLSLSLLVECRTWCARATEKLGDAFCGTQTEMELQAALGLVLMFTRGNSEAAGIALRRGLELAVALDDKWHQLRLLGRLHIFHERIGDLDTAFAWAEQAAEVAQAIAAPEAIAVAASLTGISRHLHGDQTGARRDLDLALAQSPPYDRGLTVHYGFDHRNRSCIALARTLWLQGFADQARRLVVQTEAEAARLAHPVTHCIALLWTLSVYIWSGDGDQAAVNLATFEKAANDNLLGPYIAAAVGLDGALAILDGRAGPAVALIEDSLERLHGMRYELLTTSFEMSLVEGLALDGRRAEAMRLLAATIERCEATGDGFAMPELLRLKAGLLGTLAPEEAAAVEALLVEGLDLSRRQGAQAWGLRLALDLAQIRIGQGRAAEARALLQPFQDSLAEGRDTSDLRALDRLWAEL